MKITELSNDVFYIEDVFLEANDFVKKIEELENEEWSHFVIPAWENWFDGSSQIINDKSVWVKNDDPTGKQKQFNWDSKKYHKIPVWPRKEYSEGEVRKQLRPTIDMIDKPFKDILNFWCKKTNNHPFEYVSKNYTLKKYNNNKQIDEHVDKDITNIDHTMDWTVLFYLSDDYEGGEIEFPKLNIKIKPTLGSALIFTCHEPHIAHKILKGDKYFIFMYLHSQLKTATGLREDYLKMNDQILKYQQSSSEDK